VRERTSAIRSALARGLKSAGLDALNQSAQVHLGSARATAAAEVVEVPEPPAPIRTRALGRPYSFEARARGQDRLPPISWSAAQSLGIVSARETWLLLLTTVLVPLWVFVAADRVKRSTRWALGALVPVLILAAIGGGAWALTAAVGLVATGRLNREAAA
jgi:hypothetical protein